MPSRPSFCERGGAKLAGTALALAAVLSVALLSAQSALAAGAARWAITSTSSPTNFKPGDVAGDATYVLTAVNLGEATANGPLVISDVLPAHVTAVGISGEDLGNEEKLAEGERCTLAPIVECSYTPPEGVTPGDVLQVVIHVAVGAGAPPGVVYNSATVAGGGEGVASASASDPTTISDAPASFGLANFITATSSAQAGAHPNVTTSFTFNQIHQGERVEPAGREGSIEFTKDIEQELPPGLVGSPTAAPRCTVSAVLNETCPADTAVGIAFTSVSQNPSGEVAPFSGLVYSIVPYPGEPAAFMFTVANSPVRLDTSVGPDASGDYRVHVAVDDVTEIQAVLSSTVTLWGTPADHDGRGPEHLLHYPASEVSRDFGGPGGGVARPFWTNPDVCGGRPLTSELAVDSWPEPGAFTPPLETPYPTPAGCGLLSFAPSLSVHPESLQAGVPAGYDVDLRSPQNESPTGLATPELKNATVALPAGVTLNPGAANGLEACTAQEIGIGTLAQPTCPNGSQVATATITTPLLAGSLTGHVYIGQPSNQGSSESIPLYLAAQGSGVLVKLAGTTTTNPDNGQLTTTFRETPQLPFSDLQMQFEGGPRAPLVNPQTCGEAVATSDLTPWSSPSTPDASPSFPLNFSLDGNGAPCPSSLPFAPSFAAGMTGTARAGAFSPFSVTIARQDGQQTLSQVSVQTPPGLLGMLSQVPLCGEAQANAGTCSAASQIGHTTVAAGVGPDPLYLPAPGQPPNPVYLTGPYKGAPFGLSIVIPAVAGPFDLGTVVVRAAIHIDPRTARVTVTSDPLPQMLQGIPLQARTVNVLLDRPGFMFNPTNCDPLSAGGTITGAGGASVKVSSPFQASDCALLPFAPRFTVSTQAKTSRSRGASLDFKVVDRPGQANIREVKVQLPKRLPARLTTLQKACTDTVFEANPAKCPAASDVGTAVAQTPVLPVKLAGPAFLVSHGGKAFPDLEIVLQGDGVTIVLDGGTNIRKGILTSTFSTVPDAPISSFELRLPEGPHSALAANGSLCTGSLAMPTLTAGQNGVQITETLGVKVTGCTTRARRASKARTRRK